MGMADPFPFREGLPDIASVTVTLQPGSGDERDVNCTICNQVRPEWEFTYRDNGTRTTRGLCERCRVILGSKSR